MNRLFGRNVMWILIFGVSVSLLHGCGKSDNSSLSAEQIAQDQKRFMQQINACFLKEYSSIENFNQTLEQTAKELRVQCSDEFSALRAAKLNYAIVPDVIEPPPRMVQFEVEMAKIFVEAARTRAMSLFDHHPPIPSKPKPKEGEKSGLEGVF